MDAAADDCAWVYGCQRTGILKQVNLIGLGKILRPNYSLHALARDVMSCKPPKLFSATQKSSRQRKTSLLTCTMSSQSTATRLLSTSKNQARVLGGQAEEIRLQRVAVLAISDARSGGTEVGRPRIG